MAGEIRLEEDGPIARVIVDNERKRNAISLTMWQQLGKICRQLEFESHIRVITFEGAGDDAFISGADISEFGEKRSDSGGTKAYEDATRHALDAIRLSSKPTIALIKGYCYGAGVALATACDLRYVREDAQFSIPAARLGFGYAVHLMKDLVLCVGPARAKEILITARRYDATQAFNMGLVHEVFSNKVYVPHTRALVTAVADNAPLTIRAAKLTVTALTERADSSALSDADRAVVSCFASKDAKEGREAYATKRKAEFKGH